MKNEVNVNLTLVFDHGKDKLFDACMKDGDFKKCKEFILNELLNYIQKGKYLALSEIVEYMAKNMPAEYLMFLLLNDVKEILDCIKNVKTKAKLYFENMN